MIGDNYQGTLCTDRGKSYDAKELQNVEQQKCLANIQRSIDKVLESKQGSARRFGMGLKSLLKEAIGLYHEFHKAEGQLSNYPERARELDLRITDYLRPRLLSDADNHRLLNEIGRHQDRGNLLRFLHSPQTIEPTNNAAERALRRLSESALCRSSWRPAGNDAPAVSAFRAGGERRFADVSGIGIHSKQRQRAAGDGRRFADGGEPAGHQSAIEFQCDGSRWARRCGQCCGAVGCGAGRAIFCHFAERSGQLNDWSATNHHLGSQQRVARSRRRD